MKRTVATAFITMLLITAASGTLFIYCGKANPTVFTYEAPPIISVHSPANNTSVNVNEALVNFSVTRPKEWEMTMSAPSWKISQELQNVSISVDSKLYESVTVNNNLSSAPFDYFSYLTNLTDGEHNITICASASAFEYGQWYSKPKSFTVNSFSIVHLTVDTTPPTVTVLELQNKKYNGPEVPLNFAIDEPVSKISYVLNGQENVTIAGNYTITNLPCGAHSITVFATDEVGNTGASETINFTLTKEQEPFPTVFVVAASVATIVAVGVSMLVYFKKRKHQ
jgi:hypothetical protein